MPKFDTARADLLAAAGRAMHGDRWVVPLSDDISLNPETMRKFMSGRMAVPDTLLDETGSLVRKRIRELQAVNKQIEAALPRSPASAPTVPVGALEAASATPVTKSKKTNPRRS